MSFAISRSFGRLYAMTLAFNDAVLLLYGRLSAEQAGAYTRAVANFTPAPTGSADNRALTAGVVGYGALILEALGPIMTPVAGIQ